MPTSDQPSKPLGPLLKVNRAAHHLDVLRQELARFERLRPYRYAKQRDSADNTYVYRAQVLHEVPATIPLVIGDAVHNLRSALDHLAWQLSAWPDRSTEFPVFDDPSDYQERGLRKIRGLPPSAKAIVAKLQPFQSPDPARNTLWVLHRLDIVDKHREIGVVAHQARKPVQVTHVSDDEMKVEWGIIPITDGDELVRIAADDHRAQADFEDLLKFRVAFDPDGPAQGAGIIEGLTQMQSFVAEHVIPAFGGIQ